MQTKKEELFDVLSTLNNEIVTLVTITEENSLKKSRISGEPTPENLNVVKKYALRKNLFIGTDYEQFIKKARFKEAGWIDKAKKFLFGDKFKAQGTYTIPVTENNAVLEHYKTKKKYLRTLCAEPETVSFYYDSMGNDITAEFKKLREEYFKLPSKNKSQELDNPVIVNNFSVDNVKYISTEKGTIYNQLSDYILKKLHIR